MSDIVNGVIQKLRSKYPKERYAVYTEAVEQGLREPCFFVFKILQNQEAGLGIRYKENNTYVVQYLPGSRQKRAGCNETAQELYGLLEYVTDGKDLYRGTGMHHEIQEGALHFFVDYNYFILRPKEPDEYMEKVKIYGKTSK